jgi:hypothetical protein
MDDTAGLEALQLQAFLDAYDKTRLPERVIAARAAVIWAAGNNARPTSERVMDALGVVEDHKREWMLQRALSDMKLHRSESLDSATIINETRAIKDCEHIVWLLELIAERIRALGI